MQNLSHPRKRYANNARTPNPSKKLLVAFLKKEITKKLIHIPNPITNAYPLPIEIEPLPRNASTDFQPAF